MGEVWTVVAGALRGRSFTRAPRHRVCRGPGSPLGEAMDLRAAHGREARADGDCTCPSPLERSGGLGTGLSHFDSPAGLKALAEAIRTVVAPIHPEARGPGPGLPETYPEARAVIPTHTATPAAGRSGGVVGL